MPGDDPEIEYMKRTYAAEFRAAFADAMAQLGPREQTLLRYHHIDGLNIDEIGAIYRVHRVTAFRWLEKAKETLVVATLGALKTRLNVSPRELDSVLRLIRCDVDQLAAWHELPASAGPGILFGALCAAGAAGLDEPLCHAAIAQLGIDVEPSLEGFAIGLRINDVVWGGGLPLILLPLAAQAVLLLPRVLAGVMCLLVIAGVSGNLSWFPEWPDWLRNIALATAAVVFVVVYVGVAQREREARQRAEALSAEVAQLAIVSLLAGLVKSGISLQAHAAHWTDAGRIALDAGAHRAKVRALGAELLRGGGGFVRAVVVMMMMPVPAAVLMSIAVSFLISLPARAGGIANLDK